MLLRTRTKTQMTTMSKYLAHPQQSEQFRFPSVVLRDQLYCQPACNGNKTSSQYQTLSQHRKHRKTPPTKRQQSRSKATRLVRLLHPSGDFQQGHEHSSALIPVTRVSIRPHRIAERSNWAWRARERRGQAFRNTPTLVSQLESSFRLPPTRSVATLPLLLYTLLVGRPAARLKITIRRPKAITFSRMLWTTNPFSEL